MHGHFLIRGFLIAAVFALATPDASGEFMYWTDTVAHTISRARTDGTEQQIIISTGLGGPRGIALDQAAGKLYWTDEGGNALQRSNLDGSNRETLVTGFVGPRGVALDVAAQKVYWVDRPFDRIRRADLDGQNVEIVLDSGLIDPLQIALDPGAGHMYLTDTGDNASGCILRANLDGTGLITLVGGLGDPIGIALDLSAGLMYWNDSVQYTISRANLDGSDVAVLVSTGLVFPLGLAVDEAVGRIYWTDAGTENEGRIQRSNLDGTNVETLALIGLLSPRDVVLDVECVDSVDGDPCFDGNSCTSNDVCQSGQCVGVPNSLSCNDGNLCTSNDTCQNGQCAGTPAPAACNDFEPCTVNDQCSNGVCSGTYDPSSCFHFFLMVTKVNGEECPSCPTSNLPVEEVRPGDVITIEAFMEHWEDDPDTGICDYGAGCSVATQNCSGSFECVPYPRVVAYQWALNDANLSSGLAGYLSPLEIPCENNADCTHDLSHCTCAAGVCANSVCNLQGALYIDASRPDFLFPGAPTLLVSSVGYMHLAAIIAQQGIPDSGNPVYLGTLLIKASADARGTFTVDVIRNPDFTSASDQVGLGIEIQSFTPATINLCPIVDSPNDCNGNGLPDECEPDDADGDGLIDDCDPCPADFTNQCPAGIPAASTWGIIVMTLLLMVGAKTAFANRHATAA